MFRRRKGATIRCKINVNPKLVPDDDLALATKLEIHWLPPPNPDGTPSAEIKRIATNLGGWVISASLLPSETVDGKWMMDGYAEYNNGVIVKITRTVPFTVDPKYKAP